MRSILHKPKKGQALMGTLLTVIVIGLLVIGGIAVFGGTRQTQLTDEEKEERLTDAPSCEDPTPALDFPAVNALSKSTSVAVDVQTIINGEPAINGSAKTDFSVGDELIILYRASDYINDIQEYTVKCGDTAVPTMELYATGDQTITILDDAGTSTLTDAIGGGANNESSIAEGGTACWEVKFTGTDNQASGDLVYVVEYSVPANVSSTTMSDSNGDKLEELSEVPEAAAISGTNNERVAFAVPSFEEAVKVKYNLCFGAANSKKNPKRSLYYCIL
jgi:hypothetical protein